LRKKPIIFDCKKIGVLTSASGAVIQDIRNVCQRRNPTTEILLFDCKVQGSDSENNLLRGLKYLENTDVDNIIIARGGGSSEDLSVFNSENLVYAISGCQKPVISAVGHETDFTLCDFVADCRASTPSVAAELSTVDIRAVINNFLQQFAKQIVLKQGCLENNCEQIQNYQRYLISLIVSKLTNKFDELVSIKQQLSEKMKFLISERQNIVESYLMRLDKANPAHILMKGFALLSDERGNSVNSIDKVCVDEMLMIKMHDGSIKAKVLDIEVKNEF